MIRDYEIDGYSYSFDPESVVTEFSTKNRRQRSLYQKRDTIFDVKERLSVSDFAAFEDWVHTTLNYGSDSFTGAYWDGDVQRTATMTILEGKYNFSYKSVEDIEVTYQIEIKDRDLTDGQNIYEIFTAGGSLDSAFYDALEALMNRNNFA